LGHQLINRRYATVKINNFVPWRPVLKQLPPPRSKKLAAEIDPLLNSADRKLMHCKKLTGLAARQEWGPAGPA
jgi:hypothetical protein